MNMATYGCMKKNHYIIDGVTRRSGIKCVRYTSDYDDYEAALEAGIQKAIKLIKR